MTAPFLGEIRLFAMNFPPKGWVFCQGQLLPINQNQALFSLLGTFYGGDGVRTFALPDLRGRAPMHVDYTRGTATLGQSGGEATHQLTVAEMPAHTHVPTGRPAAGQASPAGATWAGSAKAAFSGASTTTMAAAALGNSGGSQPHDNMPPYLVLNYAIALQGIFPSRS